MNKKKIMVLTLFLISIAAQLLAAALTANFGEVIIQNLRIGAEFNTREKANLPYIITNKSDKSIDIKVEVQAPVAGTLKKGYEPIPNINWIKLGKNFFTLKPNEEIVTDIIFNIPKDERLKGKKYQAIIYPYTYEGMLKIGLSSSILFTIDTVDGPYPVALNTRNTTEKVTFDLSPLEITIKDVPLGRKVKVRDLAKTALTITNTADLELNYYMNTVPVILANATLKKDYLETPDPKFLLFSEEIITIKPKQSQEVELFLSFPKDKKYAGKNYMFVIAVVLGEQEAPLVRYAYVYVTTKK